ncbi:hypothetical protein QR680_010970 [Steinernema hermaphroditum]|uniref:Uncharacterized protein n=1 Tax=Steinernema hermaphroditum TaxID=289476 RepID=A0AA39IQQ8_9BILA|nr:hypothetical protein QR680_010970 [Steinernema hermaphroditum]
MKYPISYPTIEVIIVLLLIALGAILFWTYRLRVQRRKLTQNQATALPPKGPVNDADFSTPAMEHSWLWYAPDVGLVFLVCLSMVSLFIFLRWLFLQGGPPVTKPTEGEAA